MKVLIIAGGTGGHIFPALAVADLLAQQGIQVFWLGSKAGLEKSLVPERFPLHLISVRRLRGTGWRAYLMAPFRLFLSTWHAYRRIRLLKPDIVLAMGGFVSGPGGVAAKLAGLPLVIHEQNAIAGYTNRLLARFADLIFAAYPGAFAQAARASIVGNPVRAEISNIEPPATRLNRPASRLRILILGGSQGAHALNQLIIQLAAQSSLKEQVEFWHQTGKKDYPELQSQYTKIPVAAKVEAFIEDMAGAYAWADLIICRSGALTVAEIAAVGLASILVPFPFAVDDHQWHNAQFLEQAGAAYLIREKELSPEKLSVIIENFIKDRSLIKIMAIKARDLAQPQAAPQVVAGVRRYSNFR